MRGCDDVAKVVCIVTTSSTCGQRGHALTFLHAHLDFAKFVRQLPFGQVQSLSRSSDQSLTHFQNKVRHPRFSSLQAEQQAAHENMGSEARSVAAARAAAEEEADRVRQEAKRLQQRQRDLDARMEAFESQVSPSSCSMFFQGRMGIQSY